jgi:hypothetical protein
MSGNNPMQSTAQATALVFGLYATRIKELLDELQSRVGGVESHLSEVKTTWIGTTPPTDLTKYNSWLNTDEGEFDLYFNVGTIAEPVWISPMKPGPAAELIQIPAAYGVPYFTGTTIGGREQWGVRINFGALPNATTKIVILPSLVTDDWDQSTAYIDTGSSYGVKNSGEKYTIPFVSVTSLADGIQTAILSSDAIEIATGSDRTDINAIITINYLKAID